MADLIPFATRQLGSDTVNTVTARDLYDYLHITKDYTNWIKAQIKRAHLIENEDYIVFAQKVEGSAGGRPQSEYHLTFDAAKHVALMSHAQKGHEVRAWFIAKEKELAALTTSSLPAVHNPHIQRIMEMCVQLDATEQRAIQAEATAARAEGKADMALAEARIMTLEDYVCTNGLLRQMPESQWREYADWLGKFCIAWGLEVDKRHVPGRAWSGENFYPITALGALRRAVLAQAKQITLIRPAQRHNDQGGA